MTANIENINLTEENQFTEDNLTNRNSSNIIYIFL